MTGGSCFARTYRSKPLSKPSALASQAAAQGVWSRLRHGPPLKVTKSRMAAKVIDWRAGGGGV
jgi:hypothetical protein